MKQRQKNMAKSVREGAVAERLAELRESLKEAAQVVQAKEVSEIESAYDQERSFLTRRAEMTEDLAGVGLSVEMASHDIMLLMGRAQDIGFRLARHARKGSIETVREQGRHARRRAAADRDRDAGRAESVPFIAPASAGA